MRRYPFPQATLANDRQLELDVGELSAKEIIGRMDTVVQDSQFRELLKQAKGAPGAAARFQDRWDPETGRAPKVAKDPATTIRLPHRTGVNPWRLYGPHNSRHEALGARTYESIPAAPVKRGPVSAAPRGAKAGAAQAPPTKP